MLPKTLSARCAALSTTGVPCRTDLLVQAGPRYVKALKRERASAVKRKKS
jgi:hypothetical protein